MHPALNNGTGTVRVLLALLLLATSLFACSGDFSLCKQKFIDVNALDGNRLVLPVSETTDLLYSPLAPEGEVIRAEPLLGLYLLKRSKSFKYPYIFSPKPPSKVAAVDSYMALPGKMRRLQTGLNSLAQFDQPLFAPCIVNDPCCALEGIVTHQGIIEKAYIRHFLESDNPAYGDAGVRFSHVHGKVVVESIDPFVTGNPFQAGDQIVALEGRKVTSLKALEEEVLLGGINRTCEFTLRRSGKPLKVTTVIGKRFGGGLISDTYLEAQGFYFDKRLQITASNGQVKAGDKLIRVNSRAVTSWDDVRQFLGYGDQKAVLLFERNGFQFFVHVSFRKS